MTHDMLYIPDADVEHVMFDGAEGAEILADDPTLAEDARSAEIMFSLDGWRGHYLAADYITAAADLFPEDTRDARWDAWLAAADDYRDDPYGEDPADIAEGCHESADQVEAFLSEHGYVTEWHDGVAVYRIAEA